jgi:hypothetical protein
VRRAWISSRNCAAEVGEAKAADEEEAGVATPTLLWVGAAVDVTARGVEVVTAAAVETDEVVAEATLGVTVVKTAVFVAASVRIVLIAAAVALGEAVDWAVDCGIEEVEELEALDMLEALPGPEELPEPISLVIGASSI